MDAINKAKDWVKNRIENHKKSGKWKAFLAAAILIIGFVYIWLFNTNVGWLARTSFDKTFNREEERVISIYAGNKMIAQYEGAYSIEQYQGYLVLINHKAKTRTNLYGDIIAVVDNPSPQQ